MHSEVLRRDKSPGTVAALLPLLRRIAEVTKGTEQELVHAGNLAHALSLIGRAEAEPQLRDLLDSAVSFERYDLASAAMSDLVSLAIDGGRLWEALTLVIQSKDYTRRAGLGPWTQLYDEAQRLQILARRGRSNEVLSGVHTLRHTMASLPEQSEAPERVVPWNVREMILNAGQQAALALERWEEAFALGAELLDSKRRRDAPTLEQAKTRFNDYVPLLFLGRLQEVKGLLLACGQVFQDEHDITGLGRVRAALASLEDKLGHRVDAVQLGQDALRLSYAAHDLDGTVVGHFNLADYFQRAGQDAVVALAHRLASTVIRLQIRSDQLTPSLHVFARDLASFDGDPPLPASFADLCRLVDQVDGVHFAQLVERLPKSAPDGEAALAEVLRLARELG